MMNPTDLACLALMGTAGACFVMACLDGHAERVEAEEVARIEADLNQAEYDAFRAGE